MYYTVLVYLFADVLPRILRRTFTCSFVVGVGLLAVAPFSVLGKDTGNVIRIGSFSVGIGRCLGDLGSFFRGGRD
jgi:hypothetical protein